MKQLLTSIALLLLVMAASAQPLLREDNIEEILSCMSLEEKAAILVGGGKEFPGRQKGLPPDTSLIN